MPVFPGCQRTNKGEVMSRVEGRTGFEPASLPLCLRVCFQYH